MRGLPTPHAHAQSVHPGPPSASLTAAGLQPWLRLSARPARCVCMMWSHAAGRSWAGRAAPGHQGGCQPWFSERQARHALGVSRMGAFPGAPAPGGLSGLPSGRLNNVGRLERPAGRRGASGVWSREAAGAPAGGGAHVRRGAHRAHLLALPVSAAGCGRWRVLRRAQRAADAGAGRRGLLRRGGA